MDQLNKTQFIKNRRQGFNTNLDFDSNSQSNSGSNLFSNLSLEGDYTYWLLWTLLFIIVIIICYLTVMTAKYVSTECANKRSWFNYIFRFCYNDVCLVSKLPAAPVINNVYTTNLPPMSPIMQQQITQQKTTPIPEVRKGGPSTPLFGRREVFHIANQDYTFEQARCKCESYNAKLATYDQLVDAYNEGAEWCSYGWSNGQRAYYPTQKCNWQKKSPEERLRCGNPGLNGGFFADPYLKFGVNCYGRKPRGKISKLKDPVCNNGVKYCELPQNFGASNRLETDEIAPFNGNKWNN